MSLAMIPGNENHFCAALTPTWNNFLLLRKSPLGIPHGRSRWTWGSAQTYVTLHIPPSFYSVFSLQIFVFRPVKNEI